MIKGNVWNESQLYQDPVTLRNVRQITTAGMINTIPSYHTGQAFTENGEEVIFVTVREGKSILCKANLLTGDITCLIKPVEGIGGLNEIKRFGDGKGIPIGAVLAPKCRWAYYVVGKEIRAVHIDTLEEKVIVNDIAEEYFIESIAISPDEKSLVYVIDVLYPESCGGLKCRMFMKTGDGQPELLLSEDGNAASHIMYNPVDSDLLLLCRDRGPSCAHRIDEHSRTWIYKVSERSLTEVKTVEKQNFQTHAAWTWDGEGIVYHGMMAGADWKNNVTDSGWYIGLAGLDGKPIREYSFKDAKYYGHVSAMKGKNAVIVDGNVLDGLLLWVYFDNEKPKIEIIARHDTDFTTMPCQYSHPHSICDPTGRWIVFNSARSVIFTGARSDIYSVEV